MKTRVLLVAAAASFALAQPPSLAHDHGAMNSDGDLSHSAMGSMSGKLIENDHMTMTPKRPITPADLERAAEILRVMRASLAKYRDYSIAVAESYEPFMPSVPQDVYHFSSREQTFAEYMGEFDLARPGSLLYKKKTFGGYELVGAMYSAPESATPEYLDELIPLSLGQWHAHTNICLPRGVTLADAMNGRMPMRPDIHSTVDSTRGWGRGAARARFGYLADGRFGFTGKIAEAAECSAAGGTFHRQIFGWMIHVHPFHGDDLNAVFGHEPP
jgi:hypothetical protein